MYYNSAIPPQDRLDLYKVTAADAQISVPFSTWGKQIVLKAGGFDYRDGDKRIVKEEPGWRIRAAQAKSQGTDIHIIWTLLPDYYLFNQWGLGEEDGPDAGGLRYKFKDIHNNEIVIKILTAMRIEDPDVSSFNWNKITSPYNPADYHPIKTLWLELMDNQAWNGVVTDPWMEAMLIYSADKLRILMDGGYIPNVPIVIYTRPDLLSNPLYLGGKVGTWFGSESRKQWVYLAYKSLLLNEVTSYYTCLDYADLRKWAFLNLKDSFAYSFIPEGYRQRILFHELTKNRLAVPGIADSLGNLRPIDYIIGNDAYDAMMALFAKTPVTPPPTSLDEKVKALEAAQANILIEIAATKERVARLETTDPATVIAIQNRLDTLIANQQNALKGL